MASGTEWHSPMFRTTNGHSGDVTPHFDHRVEKLWKNLTLAFDQRLKTLPIVRVTSMWSS